jgi:hypothetical protein
VGIWNEDQHGRKLDQQSKHAFSALMVFFGIEALVLIIGSAIDNLWIAVIPPVIYFIYVSIHEI